MQKTLANLMSLSRMTVLPGACSPLDNLERWWYRKICRHSVEVDLLIAEIADRDPICASELGGDLYCYFCGEFAVTADSASHGSDCLWKRARSARAERERLRSEGKRLWSEMELGL